MTQAGCPKGAINGVAHRLVRTNSSSRSFKENITEFKSRWKNYP